MKDDSRGFTLVEMAIVLVIVGLLIGGILKGQELIQNAQVNAAAAQIKSIQAAGQTFIGNYGVLPGDMMSPATRLPNCSTAPCSNPGNEDWALDAALSWGDPITSANERFLFWQHLAAAGLIGGVSNVADLGFGRGQPSSAVRGGYRVGFWGGGSFWYSDTTQPRGHVLWLTGTQSGAAVTEGWRVWPCAALQKLDQKIDDGKPGLGQFWCGQECGNSITLSSAVYSPTGANWSMGAPGVFHLGF